MRWAGSWGRGHRCGHYLGNCPSHSPLFKNCPSPPGQLSHWWNGVSARSSMFRELPTAWVAIRYLLMTWAQPNQTFPLGHFLSSLWCKEAGTRESIPVGVGEELADGGGIPLPGRMVAAMPVSHNTVGRGATCPVHLLVVLAVRSQQNHFGDVFEAMVLDGYPLLSWFVFHAWKSCDLIHILSINFFSAHICFRCL